MLVFLPWRLEFGTMLMHWVRHVHIQLRDRPAGVRAVVCCRPGDEPLFPGADEYFYDWEDLPDVRKKWASVRDGDHKEYMQQLVAGLTKRYPGSRIINPPRKFPSDQTSGNFKPQPRSHIEMPGDKWPQVLIAPRYRNHGVHRNYAHWPEVFNLLNEHYSVGLLGALSSSVDIPTCHEYWKAWFYDDNLSATLQMMSKARLVVTTDSAIAHLAVLAGARLAVIYDEPGVEAGKPEWPWAFGHMKDHAVNYCSPIIGGWKNPRVVNDFVARQVSSTVSAAEGL